MQYRLMIVAPLVIIIFAACQQTSQQSSHELSNKEASNGQQLPNKTSSLPTNSSPSSTNTSPARDTSPSTPRDQSADPTSFTFNLESAKYRISLDMLGFGVINERGDLTSKYDEVERELKRLMGEVDKFDLSKEVGLRAFGDQLGRQLKMTGKQKITMAIKSVQSGKALFVGELRSIEEGQFKLHTKSVLER